MKKAIALLLALGMLLGMLTACGAKQETAAPAEPAAAGTEAGSDKVKLTVWVNGGEDAYIPTDVSYFYEEYPNIELDLLYVPQEDCLQKIMTTISSGGELPDIVDVNFDDLGQLKSLDLWEDLTKAPYNFDTANYAPFMVESMKNDKGEFVAMMNEIPVCAVAYERNLAKQYLGTDDPIEVRKMLNSNQDYVDVGKQVTEASGGKVFAFASATDAYQMAYSQIKSPFVVDNKLTIDDTIGGAISFVADLYANGSLDLYEQWSNEWVANMSDSLTLFYPCPMWFTDWGIVANDTTGGGRWALITPPSSASQGGEVYLIPKASSAEKKEAAFTFINWLCASDSGAEAFFASNKLVSAYSGNLKEGVARYEVAREEYGGQEVYQIFIDIANMDGAGLRPSTKYDSGVYDASNGVLTDLIQGMSAADAMAKIKEGVANRYPDLVVE